MMFGSEAVERSQARGYSTGFVLVAYRGCTGVYRPVPILFLAKQCVQLRKIGCLENGGVLAQQAASFRSDFAGVIGSRLAPH
jgi:hypothetical protein